jgi:hypothetical protein
MVGEGGRIWSRATERILAGASFLARGVYPQFSPVQSVPGTLLPRDKTWGDIRVQAA